MALLLSATLGGIGIIAYAVRNPDVDIRAAIGSGSVLPFLSPSGLWLGLVRLNVEAYLTLAVLILVAVPVARSFVVWLHLHRSRDAPVAWTGLAVLLLLGVALLVLAPLLR